MWVCPAHGRHMKESKKMKKEEMKKTKDREQE